MARAKFIDSYEYSVFTTSLGKVSKTFPKIVAHVLTAGAAVIADEMRRRLQGILSPRATGELLESFGFTKVKRHRGSRYDTHIGFDGYNSRGAPNQLVSRVFESGAKYTNKTVRKARPFAKPAIKACKEQVYKTMQVTFDEDINKIMRGDY